MTTIDVTLDRVDAVVLQAAIEELLDRSLLNGPHEGAAVGRFRRALRDGLNDSTDRQFEFRVRVHLVGSELRDETSAWGRIRTAGSSLPFSFPIEQLSRRQRWAIALSRTGFLSVEISAGEVAR